MLKRPDNTLYAIANHAQRKALDQARADLLVAWETGDNAMMAKAHAVMTTILDELRLFPRWEPTLCSVEGCEDWSATKGLCIIHYNRARLGKANAGEKIKRRGKQALGSGLW